VVEDGQDGVSVAVPRSRGFVSDCRCQRIGADRVKRGIAQGFGECSDKIFVRLSARFGYQPTCRGVLPCFAVSNWSTVPGFRLPLVVDALGFCLVGSPSAAANSGTAFDADLGVPVFRLFGVFVERHAPYFERSQSIKSTSTKTHERPTLAAGISPDAAIARTVSGSHLSQLDAPSRSSVCTI
jgi:hypothetical protein